MMIGVLSWAMICLFGQVSGQADTCRLMLALQPLGTVDTVIVDHVANGIASLYAIDVSVLPGMEMPGKTYYKPGKRYRAEKILAYLDSTGDFERYTMILGITRKDISTTKGKYYDWGIFGLGYMPGRVCVISTYRLGKKKVSTQKFYERLVKVVNHELGHNFGLDHCPNQGCLMEDAKGTIKTVDDETGELCDECKAKVRAILNDQE
jgi:archaemetzincin